MSLISTVEGLGNTAGNFKEFGTDLVDNAAKMIGLENTENKNENQEYLNYNNGKQSKKFIDLRGRKSVYRAPVNTYTQNAALGTSSFKSTYSMDRGDFYWKEDVYNGQHADDYKPLVQKMIIREFQPYEQTFIGQIKTTLKNAAKATDVKASGKGITYSLMASAGSMQGKNIVSNFFKNLAIQEYSENPDKLYADIEEGGTTDTYTNPFEAVKRLYVQGVFMHTFEIPFLPSAPFSYVKANSSVSTFATAGGGGMGGVIDFMKQTASKVKSDGAKKMSESMAGLFKNIPATPTYEEKLPYDNDQITTKFYLINKNSQYLVRNYRFLQALSAGAYAVQLPFGVIQCPNIYYVEIVGKRELVWAEMGIHAIQIGKYRSDKYATYKIFNETNTQLYSKNVGNGNYEKILWPQAWDVTITFKDFTPNTFNTRDHYLTYGSCLASIDKNFENDVLGGGNAYAPINEAISNTTSPKKQS